MENIFTIFEILQHRLLLTFVFELPLSNSDLKLNSILFFMFCVNPFFWKKCIGEPLFVQIDSLGIFMYERGNTGLIYHEKYNYKAYLNKISHSFFQVRALFFASHDEIKWRDDVDV